ncbi:MAG: hypothetical protein K0R92_1004 [Lachnospiraceae bacterium]|jgi:hypothetical protein|nr:hypothetical protein [Lachnospiraceae bacterium]
MNYYDNNTRNISKNNCSLIDELKTIDSTMFGNKVNDIKTLTTRDENKALKINYNLKEYTLNSTYYPVEHAKKWVSQFKFDNLNTVISMFGFGNGIFAREIIKNMNPGDKLFIYEPSIDIFLYVLDNFNILDILSSNNTTIFIEGINEFEFHKALQSNINITNFRSQINCTYPQYDNIFKESYNNFCNELKNNYSYTKININTEIYLGQKYIDNILSNIKYLKGSNTIYELKEHMPKEVPAIIVAAGPSVKENIEFLKKAKGKAVIFAVDRVLDYLLDSGVEPDFAVTIDPKKPAEFFSKRNDVKIPLICFIEANNDVLERHNGKKIICTRNIFLNEIYIKTNRKVPFLLSSGSVAIVAYSACVELGFDKVILVGQDLAYEGKTSHVGNVEENRGASWDVIVEGVDGQPIKSRQDWKEFIHRYEDLIKIHPEIEVIDAKTKGAKIKGAIQMPLDKAIEKCCRNSFTNNQILENLEETFTEKDFLFIYEYLVNGFDALIKIKEKAEAAIQICNRLMEENKKKTENAFVIQDSMKKLSKINKFIESQPIYSMMDSYVTATTSQQLSELYLFSDNVKEDRKNTYEKSKIIYSAVVNATDYVKPKLEVAISNINPLLNP